MAKRKVKVFDRVKAEKAAIRATFFANGGTARAWAMKVGAGVHGAHRSKAARSKSACRGRVAL
jgi:hypothetical protein